MKDEQLLSAMFDDSAEFRKELLGQTLRRVKRKRRIRYAGQALFTLLIAAVAIWSSLPRRATFNSPPHDGVHIVRTSPLSAGQLVTTRQDSVVIISSDKSSLALLGDDQLLELVPGETKLLVWHAPHQAELVIIHP